jgi:hypothetical protein
LRNLVWILEYFCWKEHGIALLIVDRGGRPERKEFADQARRPVRGDFGRSVAELSFRRGIASAEEDWQ